MNPQGQPQPQGQTPLADDPAGFSINLWFNKLNIRVIGTPEDPLFYAIELAGVLDLKKHYLRIVSEFDGDYKLTDEDKIRRGLITYKITPTNKLIRKDDMVLLTELGAYRLIMFSKSDRALAFQKFVYDEIKKIRQKESVILLKMKTQLDQVVAENVKLTNKVIKLKKTKKVLKTYEDCSDQKIIYVYKREIDGPIHKFVTGKDIDDQYYYEFGLKDKSFTGTLYKYTVEPCDYDKKHYELVQTLFGNYQDAFQAIESGENLFMISDSCNSTGRYSFNAGPDDLDLPNTEIINLKKRNNRKDLEFIRNYY